MCSSECLRSVRRRRGVKGLLTRRKQANSSRTQKRSRSRSKGLFVFLGPHTGTAAFLFITLWSAKLAGSKRLSCVYSEVLHISQDSARGHCAFGGLSYGIREFVAFLKIRRLHLQKSGHRNRVFATGTLCDHKNMFTYHVQFACPRRMGPSWAWRP
jgi:hypothetical protein